jgi:hypothetical protein
MVLLISGWQLFFAYRRQKDFSTRLLVLFDLFGDPANKVKRGKTYLSLPGK